MIERVVRRTSLLAVILALAVIAGGALPAVASQATVAPTPAPPGMVAELGAVIEQARARFEARDLAGVLASVSEQYRSSGMTKAGVREQLLAIFGLHQQLRARVTLERVHLVAETAWVYTSGEVAGRLPVVGWVTVLTWQDQPEVARREGHRWRLIGFQD
jgi:hypothetical protein